MKRKVTWVENWLTTPEGRAFKEKFINQPGLIIGSGATAMYEDQAENKAMLENFTGPIIGCNESFLLIDTARLDLIIWIDDGVWTNSKHHEKLLQCTCPKFCIDPYDWKGNYLDMDILGLRGRPAPNKFSTSFEEGFCPCDDTGYLAVQVGFILGLQTIYLWGFDAWKGLYNQKAWHFGVAGKWARENGRELYVAEETSFLCHEDQDHKKLVEFKPLPVPEIGKDNIINDEVEED